MFCNYTFAPIFLLFFLSQASELKAMHQDDLEDYHNGHVKKKATLSQDKKFSPNMGNLPIGFTDLPEDILKEVFNLLKSKDLLPLREASKPLKKRVDQDYLKNSHLIIRANSSSSALQEIKNLPCSTVSLFFEKWEKEDIKPLFSFKHVTHLHLRGLQSWDFSTNELFNPDPISSCFSCILSTVNAAFLNMFGVELGNPTIFSNVTSLDLSNSSIGDYGVISFVSHFKKLQTLNMSDNDIGRNIIGEANAIANLNTLTSLNISRNHFSSETVKEMVQIKNLTSLDISYNFVDDTTVIKKLRLLPKLTNFIHKNQRQKSNSNTCLPTFFYYPLLSREGRRAF